MRKLFALIAATAIAVGAIGFVPPQTANAAICSGGYYIRVYENSAGGGDYVTWCNVGPGSPWIGYGDLNNLAHTPSGTCNSTAWLRIGDDWDDCISSVKFYLPTSMCVAFFGNPNAGGILHKGRQGTGGHTLSNFTKGNDKVTSLYTGTMSGTTCTLRYNGARYTVPWDQEE